MTDPSDYDPWYYEREEQRKREAEVARLEKRFHKHTEQVNAALRERDTDPAPGPPAERWPMITSIGLDRSLDAIERVVTWAQKGKHQGKKWAEQTAEHQVAKMLGHMAAGMKGLEADEETGEHPYAHVAARALMLLGLALEEPVPNPPERCLVARQMTGGDYYCTRAEGHTGPCAAWPRG